MRSAPLFDLNVVCAMVPNHLCIYNRVETGTSSPVLLSHGYVPYKQEFEFQFEHLTFPSKQEQIEDLANLSREYERQATARMSNTNGNNSPDTHASEPFINEPIPVASHRDRDRDRDRDRRRARGDSRDNRSRRRYR